MPGSFNNLIVVLYFGHFDLIDDMFTANHSGSKSHEGIFKLVKTVRC